MRTRSPAPPSRRCATHRAERPVPDRPPDPIPRSEVRFRIRHPHPTSEPDSDPDGGRLSLSGSGAAETSFDCLDRILGRLHRLTLRGGPGPCRQKTRDGTIRARCRGRMERSRRGSEEPTGANPCGRSTAGVARSARRNVRLASVARSDSRAASRFRRSVVPCRVAGGWWDCAPRSSWPHSMQGGKPGSRAD